ncbi:MAG: hypothetical protein KF773_32255 [Deltaproteobacteria bacterium]|nr:hypothetical protein [Deltaproteobacteria bacterium]
MAVATLAGCERADGQARLARLEVPSPAAVAKVDKDPEPAPVLDHEQLALREQAPPAPRPAAAARRPLTASARWFLNLSAAQRTNIRGLCREQVANPCAHVMRGLLPRPIRRSPPPRISAADTIDDAIDADDAPEVVAAAEPEDPDAKFLTGIPKEQHERAYTFCRESSGMPAPSCETPLVAAFDGEPIELAVSTGRERFAFVPGEPMASDWPTATTPWIARDLDGDGAITSGAELFGSSTVLGGGATARNGFEALAALDANGDGVIDARDPAFAELLLWSDRNGDHRSSPDELRPLSSVITSIPLAHTLDPRCNARGACEGERGVLGWRDATGAARTGAVVDVYLPRR